MVNQSTDSRAISNFFCAPGMLLILLAGFGGKPLHIMAPASPGGGWDRTARAMQPGLSKATGGSVQVYNVPGAGGTIGLAQFASDHRDNASQLMIGGLVMLGAIHTNRS